MLEQERIGNKIKSRIESQNITIKDLADMTGYSEDAMEYYLSGSAYFPPQFLQNIARVLHTTVDLLIL